MSGPLSGVRVLDFTRLLPGPFGTMVLGDLGAEVVRVEAPNFPDILRVMPPMDGEVSAAHREINRNKKSILLDLKNPEGPAVVKTLVKHYDVVVEQFRPGVMEKLGVGYEALAPENPRLIYCSITGYGQDGPYRLRAGHDINYLALSGVMSYTGRAKEGPLPLGIQVADQCAGGLNAVVAIIAALYSREQTGRGQYIDISMTDGAIHLGALNAMACLHQNENACREGTFLNGGSYYDFYQTSDGEYMAIGGIEPQFYAAMVKALGREDLLSMHMAVGKQGEKLKEELRQEFRKKTRKEWEEVFAQVDACVEPVLSIAEMIEHPNTVARKMVVEVPRPDGASQRQIGSPYKMSGTPPSFSFTGVAPGSNTDEILKDAGYDDARIKELRESGVVK